VQSITIKQWSMQVFGAVGKLAASAAVAPALSMPRHKVVPAELSSSVARLPNAMRQQPLSLTRSPVLVPQAR
jgi:hypothetical protein